MLPCVDNDRVPIVSIGAGSKLLLPQQHVWYPMNLVHLTSETWYEDKSRQRSCQGGAGKAAKFSLIALCIVRWQLILNSAAAIDPIALID